MLYKILTKIIEDFSLESNNSFNNEELINIREDKLNEDFQKEIIKILRKIDVKQNYKGYFFIETEDNLNIPYMIIENKILLKKYPFGLRIKYSFDFKQKKIWLTLSHTCTYFRNEEKNILNTILKELNENINIKYAPSFKKINTKDYAYFYNDKKDVIILSKFYEFDKLNNNMLINDLGNLIKIYNYLYLYKYEQIVNKFITQKLHNDFKELSGYYFKEENMSNHCICYNLNNIIEKLTNSNEFNTYLNDEDIIIRTKKFQKNSRPKFKKVYIKLKFEKETPYFYLTLKHSTSKLDDNVLKDLKNLLINTTEYNIPLGFNLKNEHPQVILLKKYNITSFDIEVLLNDLNELLTFYKNIYPEYLDKFDDVLEQVTVWNNTLYRYISSNKESQIKILINLSNLFNEYIISKEGIAYLKRYQSDSLILRKNYENIYNKYENGENVNEEIWSNLTKIKNNIFTMKSNKKIIKEEITNSNITNNSSISYFKILNELSETKDIQKQTEILENYCSNPHSNGYDSGISLQLSCISKNFSPINFSVIRTVNFISKLIGIKIHLSYELSECIQNNNKIKKFYEILSKYFSFNNYAEFYIFCQWMCSSDLGNYLTTTPNPLPLFFKKENKYYPNVYLDLNCLNKSNLIISENSLNMICSALNTGNNIILEGAPGTGKTELAINFAESAKKNKFINGYILTTATSDWTTFDTIGGFMPTDNNQLTFYEGKFLEAIRENKWLIIDEINRSDIDKSFGQLFTILSGKNVDLPYKYENKSIKIKVSNDRNDSYFDKITSTYVIGKNWRIIGTMNVYDKNSLFDLSYAFMRRFSFINIYLPTKEEFNTLIEEWGMKLPKEYLDNIKLLLNLMEYREIGPAVFKDMIKHINSRYELDPNYELIIEESILAYILPQFEGLSLDKLSKIYKFFNTNYQDTKITNKLNEFAGIDLSNY